MRDCKVEAHDVLDLDMVPAVLLLLEQRHGTPFQLLHIDCEIGDVHVLLVIAGSSEFIIITVEQLANDDFDRLARHLKVQNVALEVHVLVKRIRPSDVAVEESTFQRVVGGQILVPFVRMLVLQVLDYGIGAPGRREELRLRGWLPLAVLIVCWLTAEVFAETTQRRLDLFRFGIAFRHLNSIRERP